MSGGAGPVGRLTAALARLRRWLPIRLRRLALILVFDLAGPLTVYAVMRSAGLSAVVSLVISGVPPAIGIAISAIADRRLDVIGAVVLAGIAVGTVLGLTSGSARLFLIEGSVPTTVFAVACLLSARTTRPLIFRLALDLIGPETPKGREVTGAWRYPAFRRAFRIITVAWGVGYLIEAAVRVIIAETAPTGAAFLFSKVMPYVFAVAMSIWTLGYGERHRNKAIAGARIPRLPPCAGR
jgi:hypothetical protein